MIGWLLSLQLKLPGAGICCAVSMSMRAGWCLVSCSWGSFGFGEVVKIHVALA